MLQTASRFLARNSERHREVHPLASRWTDLFMDAIQKERDVNLACLLDVAAIEASVDLQEIVPDMPRTRFECIADVIEHEKKQRGATPAFGEPLSTLNEIRGLTELLADGVVCQLLLHSVRSKRVTLRYDVKWTEPLVQLLVDAGYMCDNDACVISVATGDNYQLRDAALLRVSLPHALVGHCIFAQTSRGNLPRAPGPLQRIRVLNVFVDWPDEVVPDDIVAESSESSSDSDSEYESRMCGECKRWVRGPEPAAKKRA